MTAKQYILKSLQASIGLFIYSFGLSLTLQADIGLAPWDVFAMGIANKTGLSFGMITMLLGFVVIATDILMKERIGIGTLLDALIVGVSTDFFVWLNVVPKMKTVLSGSITLIISLFIMAIGVRIYMAAGLCCGPRDSLLIAVGKRMRKFPMGIVELVVQGSVLIVGWLLGGPVGIGTLIAVFGIGISIQIVFSICRFEPRNIIHFGFSDIIRQMSGKQNS